MPITRNADGSLTFASDQNPPHLDAYTTPPNPPQSEIDRLSALYFPPAEPTADWYAFWNVFFAPPDEAWMAILGLLAPASQLALFIKALETLANNGGEHLAAAIYWQAILRDCNLTAEQIQLIKEYAKQCSLPSKFIFFLGGVPEAVAVGQEWSGPDGVLWRVVQRTNPDGTFAEDNPTTAKRESLEWARVEEG